MKLIITIVSVFHFSQIFAQEYYHNSVYFSDSGQLNWITKNQELEFDLNCKKELNRFVYGWTVLENDIDNIIKLQFLNISITNPKFKYCNYLDNYDTIYSDFEKYKDLFSTLKISVSQKNFDLYLIRNDFNCFEYLGDYDKFTTRIEVSEHWFIQPGTKVLLFAIKRIDDVIFLILKNLTQKKIIG